MLGKGWVAFMDFGINSFTWESPFNTESARLIAKAEQMGFDIFEVALEAPEHTDLKVVQKAFQSSNVKPSVCGAFGPTRDISSNDRSIQKQGMEYIAACIEAARVWGSEIVGGPMYSCVGKARALPDDERKKEWNRSVAVLKELAQEAARSGISLAIEPLNRFEIDMINTVEQAVAYVDQVNEPNVGIHIDLFHGHIEEKDIGAALRMAGDRLLVVHASENDRGTPGKGQVRWTEVAEALNDIGYRGGVTIESFTPDAVSVRQAACIWRPLAESQDALAREGLAFLRELFEEGSVASA